MDIFTQKLSNFIFFFVFTISDSNTLYISEWKTELSQLTDNIHRAYTIVYDVVEVEFIVLSSKNIKKSTDF